MKTLTSCIWKKIIECFQLFKYPKKHIQIVFPNNPPKQISFLRTTKSSEIGIQSVYLNENLCYWFMNISDIECFLFRFFLPLPSNKLKITNKVFRMWTKFTFSFCCCLFFRCVSSVFPQIAVNRMVEFTIQNTAPTMYCWKWNLLLW